MLSMEQVEERLNFWNFPQQPWHLGTIGNFPIDLNPRTIVMTWVAMILVIIFAVAATRNMDMRRPGKLQVAFEFVYDFVRGLVNDNMDPVKGLSLLSIVLTYFIFILFSNLLGLIPTLNSPTADYNTTFALSLFTFVLIQFFGLKYKGFGHFKHFVKPVFVFLPINLVEELSKPVTLAFRLYGNIYAGEVLIAVLLGLFPLTADIFGGFIASVIWLGFSIFVGCIQAFIFTMLSIAYVGQVVADEH